MTKLRVDRLKENMILKEDVFSPLGRFLFSSGSILREKHIRILKSWGVSEVFVEEEAEERISYSQYPSSMDMTRLLEYIDDLFYMMPKSSFFKELRRIITFKTFNYILLNGFKTIERDYVEVENEIQDSPIGRINMESMLDDSLPLYINENVFSFFMECFKNPMRSNRELSQIVNKDPLLCMNFLKQASAYDGKVNSMREVFTNVGSHDIYSFISSYEGNLYDDKIKFPYGDVLLFWRESLACAVFSDLLEFEMNGKGKEETYLAALMKNLGLLVMIKKHPYVMERVFSLAINAKTPLEEAERVFFSFSHVDLTREMLVNVGVSSRIINALENPVVRVASVLSFAFFNTLVPHLVLPHLDDKDWDSLFLSSKTLDLIISRGDRRLREIFLFLRCD